MTDQKRRPPKNVRLPVAERLRLPVQELLGIEQALRALDEIFAQQKADYRAELAALHRRRGEVMAELRGDGRQTRLEFNEETGEVKS